ncbi:MAG: YqaE/Pmp3 family membrane protein [Muribaculaceae bacterium]|nr:YqaE/Pmp3 family membrane protein [Muribaculaceae bacterium]
MSLARKILAVVFPPFAVVDKGCGTYLVAFALTCLGWIPGIIYAFVVLRKEQRKQGGSSHQVGKLQNKQSSSISQRMASNNRNDNTGTQQQSPFDRPRRMSNNNNQNGGWQGW